MKIPVILLCIVLILSITSGCEKTTQVYIDTVATPVFSPEPYMYNLPMEVSIYCATPGVEIRYTTEGYYTAENSHRYTGPITINATTTIKAVAFKKGMNHSELATGNFLANTGWGMWCDIVNIQADPDTIFASGENSTSVISVKVLDGLQFSIANQPVQFHANYGNIPENALTDSSGVARATYTPPLGLAGVARITATVERYNPDYPDLLCSADTAYIEVTIQPSPPGSQEVHALQFYQSGQIDLNVINTGGVEDYSARVKLYDGNSNLFIEPRSVWFKIMNANPLTGVNLNGHSPSDSVLVISSNGIAQVTLNSGIQSGSLTIRASCTDAGHYVTALKSNIVIHPGPPHRLEPFMGGFSTG